MKNKDQAQTTIIASATAATTAAVLSTNIEFIKKDVGSLQTDVKTILENHLPHLTTEMEKLNTKITLFTGINIGAIILGLIVSRLIR